MSIPVNRGAKSTAEKGRSPEMYSDIGKELVSRDVLYLNHLLLF